MYSIPTDNLSFRKGCNSNAKRFCCSPKQRTFKRDAYTATYDLDNKLQTFGNKTITYDNDGNMTSGPITEGGNNAALEFNARGQLMGTGDVAYAYDLENTRTIVMHYDKNKILTQYRYVYNRVGNVPEVLMRVKLTNMTSQSTYYVYGAGLAYEVKITPDGQEAVRYYHYDQVGSTVAMTDSAQAITDRFHYDPWGYVLHSIGDSDTPFQFVGAYGIQTDPNGLINMRARYYNPVTKSFISQDPSGFEGGLNWYLYANGNPFTYIDPNGEFAITAIVVGALIGAGLDIVTQLGEGRSVSEINWWRVAGFGTVGGLTSGIGSAAIKAAVYLSKPVMAGSTITRGAALSVQANLAASAMAVKGGQLATKLSIQVSNQTLNIFPNIMKTTAYAGFLSGASGYDNSNWTNGLQGSEMGYMLSPLISTYSVFNSIGSSVPTAINYTCNSMNNIYNKTQQYISSASRLIYNSTSNLLNSQPMSSHNTSTIWNSSTYNIGSFK